MKNEYSNLIYFPSRDKRQDEEGYVMNSTLEKRDRRFLTNEETAKVLKGYQLSENTERINMWDLDLNDGFESVKKSQNSELKEFAKL